MKSYSHVLKSQTNVCVTLQAHTGSAQGKVLSTARPQSSSAYAYKKRPDRVKAVPLPIASASAQPSSSQDPTQEPSSSQSVASASQGPHSGDVQLAATPSSNAGSNRGLNPSAKPSSSDRNAGMSASSNSMVPDRGQRGGRSGGRGGSRQGRGYDGQVQGPPAPPSGVGRSEGARRGRSGRTGGSGYRQQQSQYQGMPAQSMAPQQVYYPVGSSMYYPPAAFGIPAAVPGLPAISQEQLQLAVRQQIEYYFSLANLVKDVFLRSKMNEEGWIALHAIASFNRVRMLTPDLAMIMEALTDCPTVELSGDNLFLRPRVGYQQWILPESQRDASAHALPHMLASASSNIMKSAGQQHEGSTAGSLPDVADGDTASRATDSTTAQTGSGRHTEGSIEQASTSKDSDAAVSSEEASIQEAAPATPTNSKQERSADDSSSSPSPLEAGHPAPLGSQGTKAAAGHEEDHPEEDMFEMDEVTRSDYEGNHA